MLRVALHDPTMNDASQVRQDQSAGAPVPTDVIAASSAWDDPDSWHRVPDAAIELAARTFRRVL